VALASGGTLRSSCKREEGRIKSCAIATKIPVPCPQKDGLTDVALHREGRVDLTPEDIGKPRWAALFKIKERGLYSFQKCHKRPSWAVIEVTW
jgi:hypothetical protein